MNNTHKLELRIERLEKELEEALYINDQKDEALGKMQSCMADKYVGFSKKEINKLIEWLKDMP